MNLGNDHFVGGSQSVVAKRASSAYNNGYVGGYDKIWMYTDNGRKAACVPPGSYDWSDFRNVPYYGNYRQSINDSIVGFK